MSRDMHATPLHLHAPSHADLLEDFTRTPLVPDTIYVPPQHQPINPEDEDDVVPDQHAAFGITRAMGKEKDPAWRELGLEALMGRMGGVSAGASASAIASGTRLDGANGGGSNAGAGASSVGLALRTRAAAEARSGRVRANGGSEGSRNEGLPR